MQMKIKELSDQFVDSYKHKGERKLLIEHLRKRGITEEQVLDVMLQIPRHFYFHKDFWDHAYEDKAFQIGAGQTISHPHTVAYQTQLLEIKSNDKVLEIGTGSGYQTSILLELGADVYTIERQKELFDKTKKLLSQLSYKPKYFFGDGSKGIPAFAPFDKIICTAGSPSIPNTLLAQLKIGGSMVIPVGDENQQKMNLVKRVTQTEFHTEVLDSFRFVPMIGEQAW
jgi:protein-L-isoaspartate(D-aspartate) O-methyltransferase